MSYLPSPIDVDGSLLTSISNDRVSTAFGRLRIASPFSMFSAKQDQGQQAALFTASTSGSGSISYNQAHASTTLQVSTANGDVAIRQTKAYVSYQPGKSQLILATGILGTGQSNTIKRVGYFDATNGFFFELNGTTLNVVRRTSVSGSPVDNAVAQSSWNIDKLDGMGRSGLAIDVTKAQIFVIDFQWLGVGRVRMGVDIDGRVNYCHEFQIGNHINSVSVSTPNLPVRYEIRNTGTAAASSTLEQICCAVMSEGGTELKGLPFSADNGITTVNVGVTLLPVLSIRLKSASARSVVLLQRVEMLVDSSTNFRWTLLLNPTLTTPSWTSVASNSYAEKDTASTSMSGGTQLFSGYGTSQVRLAQRDFQSILPFLNSDFSGTSDILTLAVQNLTGVNKGYVGAFNWLEVD